MLSDNATANDLLQFIDQLKEFKRNHAAADVSPLIDRFMDHLFKAPIVPQESLTMCAHRLYNELINLDGGLSDFLAEEYQKYDDICSNVDDYEAEDIKTELLNATEHIHSFNDSVELISNMMKSLEKLFGFSIDTCHECPI